MTAEEFKERLAEYVDGELNPAERARMDRKVAESPGCAALHNDMLALKERLRNLPKERPSAEFEFALRSQVLLEASHEGRARERVKQVLFPSPLRAALTAVAAAVVMAGAAALLQEGPEPVSMGQDVFRLMHDGASTLRSTQPAQPALEAPAPTFRPIDRGALTRLSEQESIELSSSLYRSVDSAAVKPSRIPVDNRGAVPAGNRQIYRRTPVSSMSF